MALFQTFEPFVDFHAECPSAEHRAPQLGVAAKLQQIGNGTDTNEPPVHQMFTSGRLTFAYARIIARGEDGYG